jgi:hypothetical protein
LQPLSESGLLSQESAVNSESNSESFTESLAKEQPNPNEPEYNYSHLNNYTDNMSFTGSDAESATENHTEINSGIAANDDDFGEAAPELSMGDDDAAIMAGFGVSTLNGFLPAVFGAPVSMTEDQHEQLAKKAMPLVKKYYSSDNVPDWLKKYQDEIGFGLAMSTMLFGCFQQAKVHKLANPKATKKAVAEQDDSELAEVA